MKSLMMLAVCLAPPLCAGDMKEIFARHWQTSKDFTLAVAEAMPAENYDFKPNPEEMSFGKLMAHIAMANNNAFAMVSGIQAPAVPEKIVAAYKDPNGSFDKTTTTKFLSDSFEFCTNAFNHITAEQLDAMTGPAGRQMTGHERLWSYFTHTAHHRGQAEVYMRVKNLKPPAYRF